MACGVFLSVLWCYVVSCGIFKWKPHYFFNIKHFEMIGNDKKLVWWWGRRIYPISVMFRCILWLWTGQITTPFVRYYYLSYLKGRNDVVMSSVMFFVVYLSQISNFYMWLAISTNQKNPFCQISQSLQDIVRFHPKIFSHLKNKVANSSVKK